MEEQPSILTWKIVVLLKNGWFEVHALWNWNWKIQGEKNMEKRENEFRFNEHFHVTKSARTRVSMTDQWKCIHWIAWNKISSWPSSIYSFIHAVRPDTHSRTPVWVGWSFFIHGNEIFMQSNHRHNELISMSTRNKSFHFWISLNLLCACVCFPSV